MAEVVYLAEGEEMPDEGDDMRWLRIDHSGDGRFFGSGSSWKDSGEWVGYGSLSENDMIFEAALTRLSLGPQILQPIQFQTRR